jgi:hypothetical protein
MCPDWRVAAGEATGIQSFQTFQTILNNASDLTTGYEPFFHFEAKMFMVLRSSFIVLQHDVHEITVDLAVGYTLDAALHHNPPFTLKAIGECMKFPNTDLYLETTQNTTFPYPNKTTTDVNGDGTFEVTREGGSGAALTRTSIFTVLLGVAVAASGSVFFF